MDTGTSTNKLFISSFAMTLKRPRPIRPVRRGVSRAIAWSCSCLLF